MTEVYAAGAVAAFTIDLLVYPLDTIKTRYQSQDYIKADPKSAAHKPLALRGLYQGIGSVILATVPAAGIFFSTYEGTKDAFSKVLPLPEPLIHSSASSVAEMASCAVLAPAEVIKQNAQMLKDRAGASHIRGSTSLQAFRQLGGAGAAKRLFTGYTALVARNLPFTALQFPMFEHIRMRLWQRKGGEPSVWEKNLLDTMLICGGSAGSAGAVAAFITTPSDVVKTRMMLFAGSGDEKLSKEELRRKRGAWGVTKQVFQERGIRGFFRGGLFRSAWTALGSGLYLGTYETAKVWLKRRKPEIDDSVGL